MAGVHCAPVTMQFMSEWGLKGNAQRVSVISFRHKFCDLFGQGKVSPAATTKAPQAAKQQLTTTSTHRFGVFRVHFWSHC